MKLLYAEKWPLAREVALGQIIIRCRGLAIGQIISRCSKVAIGQVSLNSCSYSGRELVDLKEH